LAAATKVPEVYASFLSADGDTLAYSADKLYFVDTATGGIRRAVSLGGAHNLVLTDDLRTAAVAAHRDGSISIRDTADGTETLKIEINAVNLTPYCFSNDGSLLAVRQQVSQDTGQNATSLAIYNTTTGEQLYHIQDEELVGSNASRFSPDNTKLAVSQLNSAILLLELQHFRVALP
jgi:hypothetical protein